jgi:predicted DNA-binding ArsR family transcriptional regulator
MKGTDILIARLNIKISINRLLFRMKLANLSDEKVKAIEREANDLNYALKVFKMLEDDNATFERVNSSLRLEILYLKQELDKQQKDEILQDL